MGYTRFTVQAVPRNLVHGRCDWIHEGVILGVCLPGLGGSPAVERRGDMEHPPQASHRDIRAQQRGP